MNNDGINKTSIGFDMIYFGRVGYLSGAHRKKIETLRELIDEKGIRENIDWKPIDQQTRKKYGRAKKK